ncbi:hypothetical protein, partial [Methylovulum psychrotolerans]|uniref:hypothetical protein n=1 Tax=Methylovulum psychrotolerans TaxID=1704499 RepID=UPI001B8048C7
IIEELRFEFCAGSISKKEGSHGFNIIIDVRGLVVYSFFLEISLVDHLDQTLPNKFEEPILLDLDNVNQRVKNFECRISKEEHYA